MSSHSVAPDVAPPAAPGIDTWFQPIVSLRDGRTLGFEALTRVPPGSGGPADVRALLAAAVAEGKIRTLERSCWRNALSSAHTAFARRSGWTNLFINVLPESVTDLAFRTFVQDLLEETGVVPGQIVLEITEGSRIDDYDRFRDALAVFRTLGLRIALDDAGAGHSGLQTISELVPDFVKVDQNLVRGVDRHPGRHAAVEALALLARRLGCALIAEGVETEAELLEVCRLGIPYAQGYFLGRPDPVPSDVQDASLVVLRRVTSAPELRADDAVLGGTAGDVQVPTPSIRVGTRVQEVFELFERGRLEGVVILRADQPCGVLTRSRLYRSLSQRFGRELHLRRAVEEVAVPPLVVDARASLQETARAAMERPDDTRYDMIVVARDGVYAGTVSVQHLLEAIMARRVQSARMENPLTGLPGNPMIEAEIDRLVDLARPAAILYVDLDHFKAFNDVYGFHHGDRAIRATARVLTSIRDELGCERSFLGHVGGDDFVLICRPEHADTAAEAARRRVPQELAPLYAASERASGFLEARDRDGGVAQFPLIRATVAALIISGGEAIDRHTVLERLAEAKRTAKMAGRR